MITATLINQICKIIWVRQDSNKKKMVCRIYPLENPIIPENVLDEIIPGTGFFKDPVTKERFKLTGESLLPI
jgi:hypothetical protein